MCGYYKGHSKVLWTLVSIIAMGSIVALILPPLCFLVLLANYTNIFMCFFYLHHLMTSLKYSFLNSPKQQYFMLLTSGG